MGHILVVDDDVSVRQLVCKLLEIGGHRVEAASSGAEALATIEVDAPELIVLDLQMPDMSGMEVCRAVKSNPFTAGIPILMLTAQSDIDHKVEGFEAGADDYLGKPFEPRELAARVVSLLRLVRREGDRNPSSGLPGGQAIHAEMERRVAAGLPFALCYIDLDKFKPFADTYGFSVADIVIRDTGVAIRGAVETCGASGDFVGHIGGDDFLVITEATRAEPIAHETSRRFAEVARAAVGEEAMRDGYYHGVDRDGHAREFPIVGVTVVVLLVDPDTWISINHLGSFAAELKRQAKTQGSGMVVVRTA